MKQNHLISALRWLRSRAENVAVLLLSLMFISFVVQIFSRYIFNTPVGWTDEVSILCWIWTVLWGAAFLITEKEEVRFDIFYSAVSDQIRRVFTIISGLVLIGLYGISLPAAYQYVAFMKVERSAYLKIPMNYLYAIYVIFAVACLCRYTWLVWNAIRGGKSPSTDPAQLTD